MIARHEQTFDKNDIWGALAAPVPAGTISWRQDGRALQRDGKWIARFVAYIEASTVRERLDAVVPGEWDLTLDLLPPSGDPDGELMVAFKARLQILGVIREDVGMGRDYKAAATDAFKRAAVRFGIGHELYAMEQNWVPVDGEGRYARPLEDPQAAYDRRYSRASGVTDAAADQNEREPAPADSSTTAVPSCPKCGGRMWDNRLSKRNPKAPDFKCRDRSCDGVVWPPRDGRPAPTPATTPAGEGDDMPDALGDGDDDLPF